MGDAVSDNVDFAPWLNSPIDGDGDGCYGSPCGDDCDDNDPNEFRGQTWYKDTDDDGYSDGTSATQCERPDGYKIVDELIADSGDCDDDDATVNPGATEVTCDGIDNDCDPTTPDNPDVDQDGYGDCDDNNPAVNPGAEEICDDGIDNDCDGDIDGEDDDCAPVGGATLATDPLRLVTPLAGAITVLILTALALGHRRIRVSR